MVTSTTTLPHFRNPIGIPTDPGMKVYDVHSRCADRHGLITRSAARTAGLSTSGWYRAIASGHLVEVFGGVATLPGATVTPTMRIAAAVASVGRGVMASHRSCAFLLGLIDQGDEPIDLLRPGRGSRIELPGVVVHRPRDLLDLRPMIHEGILMTNPLRMICDIGAVAPEAVDGILTELRIRGLVSLPAAKASLMRHAERGRTGIGALRAAIDAQELSDAPPDSLLEEKMARLARRFGLPPMEFHARVAGYEVDFLVTGTPVVLECEGWESHGRRPEQFRFDKERTAALVAAGYVVVPFTWMQVTRHPARTAERIRQITARWSQA